MLYHRVGNHDEKVRDKIGEEIELRVRHEAFYPGSTPHTGGKNLLMLVLCLKICICPRGTLGHVSYRAHGRVTMMMIIVGINLL